MELDMLKDGPSLPSIGMRYGMHGSIGQLHMFGLNQADLAEQDHRWRTFHRVQTARGGRPHCCVDDWLCCCRSPLSCPMAGLRDGSLQAWGPVAYCQWAWSTIGPATPARGWLSSATVFQFQGRLFHGHDCRQFEDARLRITAQERRDCTERDKDYLRATCGYMLLTIWECKWNALNRTDPSAAGSARMSRSRQRPTPVCRPLGPICTHFCRPYIRTESSATPRWISIHPRGWRTSSRTYRPSSSRNVQGGRWTAYGPVLRGCWHRISAPAVPDQ